MFRSFLTRIFSTFFLQKKKLHFPEVFSMELYFQMWSNIKLGFSSFSLKIYQTHHFQSFQNWNDIKTENKNVNFFYKYTLKTIHPSIIFSFLQNIIKKLFNFFFFSILFPCKKIHLFPLNYSYQTKPKFYIRHFTTWKNNCNEIIMPFVPIKNTSPARCEKKRTSVVQHLERQKSPLL